MEHKTWLWRRKLSEKTITSGDKPSEQKERASELEKSLEDLSEQLSSASAESNAKDGLLAKQAKVAEEAIAGWEKAEAEASSFKQELDHALSKKAAAEERIASMDATLKECMLQLHIFKEEKVELTNDALTKVSREQEKAQALEMRLAETNKNLGKLAAEYSNVCKLLEVKEKVIEDQNEHKTRSEANLSTVISKLDKSEKDNAALRYEIYMLQKELEIRSDERDFNLKSADASYKQHLDSIKKITKLETECQRLRIMVRKRLPGPGALVKMRSEVEMLGNNTGGTRRKKLSSAINGFMSRDFVAEDVSDASRSSTSLMEMLRTTREENKVLNDTLGKKNIELETLRSMFTCTASKLSHAESQLEESPKGQASTELAKYSPLSYELPLASISEHGGNEDNASCSESWASALISELEHFRNGKPRAQSCLSGVSDISLMDDFAEMERWAIVCVESPVGSSNDSIGGNKTSMKSKETGTGYAQTEPTGRELVPVDSSSGLKEANCEIHSNCHAFEKYPNWLQDILRVIMQKQQTMQVNLDFILEEIRVALSNEDHSAKGVSQHVSSHEVDGTVGIGIITCETFNQPSHLSIEKSVNRLVELVEDIIQRCLMNRNSELVVSGHVGRSACDQKSPSATEYIAWVFLLKNNELTAVLRRFIMACKGLLYGKADLKNFFEELTSSLDWIINHCFSLQDVSNMEETIKKRFDGDACNNDDEHEAGMSTPRSEADSLATDQVLRNNNGMFSPLLQTSTELHILSQMEEMEAKTKGQNRIRKCESIQADPEKDYMEKDLGPASSGNQSSIARMRESVESISCLHVEPGKVKESNRFVTNQVETNELIRKDLSTLLTVSKVDASETRQSSLACKTELEEKIDSPQSLASKLTTKCNMDTEENQLAKEYWEFSSTSVKLAECQETILNLGKQLKALASPKDAALIDKVMSSPVASRAKRRILLDQMQEEDGIKSEELKSPQKKEIIRIEPREPPTAPSKKPNVGMLYGQTILANNDANDTIASIVQTSSPAYSHGRSNGFYEAKKQESETERTLAIVPKKQKAGVGFFKKLLSGRKKQSSKKRMSLTYQ